LYLCCIGQRRSSVLRIYNLLKKEGAMSYTCIVSSTSSCKASLQYLTPYVGTTIENFLWKKDIMLSLFMMI